MKPKQTLTKKREIIQRKNRTHWMMHRHQIAARRNEKQSKNTAEYSSVSIEPDKPQLNMPIIETSRNIQSCSSIRESSVHTRDNIRIVDESVNDSNESQAAEPTNLEDHEVDSDSFDEDDGVKEFEDSSEPEDSYFQTTIDEIFEREYDELVRMLLNKFVETV